MGDRYGKGRAAGAPGPPPPPPPGGRGIARVVLVGSPPCEAAPRCAGLERKRRALWRNEKRNRLIATLARACQGGDVKALAELGICVRRSELPRGLKVRRVAVLVESTE